MAVQEDPELTSFHAHTWEKYTATYRTIPSEKDLKISQRAPLQQRRKGPWERKMYQQNLHPQYGDPKFRGISKIPST